MISKEAKANILICMPTYRNLIVADTVFSLTTLKDYLAENGIGSKFTYVESFDVVTARNIMATYFFENEAYTHLLFIDDDMIFEAPPILDMLRADKPIIGCVCTKRSLDLERLFSGALEGKSFSSAMADSVEFALKHRADSSLTIADGLCQIEGIGMAVTMIQRRVLGEMLGSGCVKRRALKPTGATDALGNLHHFGFFDQIQVEERESLLAEDYSFCLRWRRDCQGEIWALVTPKIGHVGLFTFEGRYLDRLHSGRL